MAHSMQPRRSDSGAAPVRLLGRGESDVAPPPSSRNTTVKPRSSSSSNNNSNSKPRPAKKTPTTRGSSQPRPIPPSPPPPRSAIEDAQVLVQRIAAWEKSHRDYEENMESARPALRNASVELIKAYPKTAKKLRISERLWKNWYREIDELQAQPRLSASQLQVLRELLLSCSTFYATLVKQLRGSLRRPNLSPDHQEGLRYSLQLSLVALGDVTRYLQNQLPKSESRDWSAAKNYYCQALEVAPSNGKVYNQLGLLSVLEGKLLDGAYLYARSLACEIPFGNSDNLLHVLQRGKSPKRKLHSQQPHDGPTGKAMAAFSERVLSCFYMLLAGETSDMDWNKALEHMRVALDRLLGVWDLQDDMKLPNASAADALSTALVCVVCLVITLTHNTQHKLGEVSTHQAYDEAFANWDGSNKLTLNSLAIGNVVVACLLSRLIQVLSDSTESTGSRHFVNAVLPAVNIYLDWLHLHPELINQLNSYAVAFKDACVNLFQTFVANEFVERRLCCSSKRGDDLLSVVLPEDRKLSGFLPSEKACKMRLSGDLVPLKNLQLTEEELLVTRASRFMTQSENYVFPGRLVGQPSASNQGFVGGCGTRTEVRVSSCSSLASSSVSDKRCSLSVDPFETNSVHSGRLCVLCSNTTTFTDGECEFCGYEDDNAEDMFFDGEEGQMEILSLPVLPRKDATSGKRSESGTVELSASPHDPHCTLPLAPPQSEVPPEKLETDFRAIMSIGAEHVEFQGGLEAIKDQRRLIVIDAPNVAMRHGKGKTFSCAGIELAVKYFQALGHRVVAFIPDYMFQSDGKRAQREQEGTIVTAAKIPDDIALLDRMMDEGVLIPTPSQDYDDSYSIQYAGLHDGFVVTNDLFRDHIVNMVGPRERKIAMRAWLRAHQISYSWVRNEFIPNPNFRFPDAADVF